MVFSTRNPVIVTAAAVLAIITAYSTAAAQRTLTLNEAQKIAENQSPQIKQLQLQISRYEELLLAQKASLKTYFSLSLTPYSYEQGRTFNNFFSEWNTTEEQRSSGDFVIRQRLPWTDGTLFFTNSLSWQNS